MVLIKNGIKGNKEKEWWQLVFDHFPHSFHKGLNIPMMSSHSEKMWSLCIWSI